MVSSKSIQIINRDAKYQTLPRDKAAPSYLHHHFVVVFFCFAGALGFLAAVEATPAKLLVPFLAPEPADLFDLGEF